MSAPRFSPGAIAAGALLLGGLVWFVKRSPAHAASGHPATAGLPGQRPWTGAVPGPEEGIPSFDAVRAHNVSLGGGPYSVPVGTSIRIVPPTGYALEKVAAANAEGDVLRTYDPTSLGEFVAARPGTQVVSCQFGVPGEGMSYQASVQINAG